MIGQQTQIKDEEDLIDFLDKSFELDPEELMYQFDPEDNEFVSLVTEVKIPQSINLMGFVSTYFTNYTDSNGDPQGIEMYRYELVNDFNIEFYINHANKVITIYVTRKC